MDERRRAIDRLQVERDRPPRVVLAARGTRPRAAGSVSGIGSDSRRHKRHGECRAAIISPATPMRTRRMVS